MAFRFGGGGGGRIDCGPLGTTIGSGDSAAGADFRQRFGANNAASSPINAIRNSGPRMPSELRAGTVGVAPPFAAGASAHAAGFDRALNSGPTL